MAGKQMQIGDAGVHIAQTVRRRRQESKLTHAALSQQLTAFGRPIPAPGLRRIEALQRRVDVDDLYALAQILGFDPLEFHRPAPAMPAPARLRAAAYALAQKQRSAAR